MSSTVIQEASSLAAQQQDSPRSRVCVVCDTAPARGWGGSSPVRVNLGTSQAAAKAL